MSNLPWACLTLAFGKSFGSGAGAIPGANKTTFLFLMYHKAVPDSLLDECALWLRSTRLNRTVLHFRDYQSYFCLPRTSSSTAAWPTQTRMGRISLIHLNLLPAPQAPCHSIIDRRIWRSPGSSLSDWGRACHCATPPDGAPYDYLR
jgi:hypothetical protein